MRILISATLVIYLLFVVLAPSTTLADDCLTAGFWVEDSFYNFFKSQGVDFNEWSNKQMDRWNKAFSDSGVNECVRIGKIVRRKDGELPLSGGLPTNNPDMKDRTVDLQWGFPASEVESKEGKERVARVAQGIDWALLHELSHARYLIDEYGLDISTKTPIDILAPDGKPIKGTYLKPVTNDLFYKNKSRDFMSDWEQYFYAPHSATALNLVSHQHWAEKYGNYNAPSNLGVYLNDLPANNILRILDTQGTPLAGARVRIFQAQSLSNGIGWDGKAWTAGSSAGERLYAKGFPNVAAITGQTDSEGKISVGRNPFGGNKIDPLLSNGVFILEVSYQDQLYYQFMEVSDFNLAYWKGATAEAVYNIATNLSQSLCCPVGYSDNVLVCGVSIGGKSSCCKRKSLTEVEKIDKQSCDMVNNTGGVVKTFELVPNPVFVGDELIIKGAGFGDATGTLKMLAVDTGSDIEQNEIDIQKWEDSKIALRLKNNAVSADSKNRWSIQITTSSGEVLKSAIDLTIKGQAVKLQEKAEITDISPTDLSNGESLIISGTGFGSIVPGLTQVIIYQGAPSPASVSIRLSDYLVPSWTNGSIKVDLGPKAVEAGASSQWKIRIINSKGEIVDYGDTIKISDVGRLQKASPSPTATPTSATVTFTVNFKATCGEDKKPLPGAPVSIRKNKDSTQLLAQGVAGADGRGTIKYRVNNPQAQDSYTFMFDPVEEGQQPAGSLDMFIDDNFRSWDFPKEYNYQICPSSIPTQPPSANALTFTVNFKATCGEDKKPLPGAPVSIRKNKDSTQLLAQGVAGADGRGTIKYRVNNPQAQDSYTFMFDPVEEGQQPAGSLDMFIDDNFRSWDFPKEYNYQICPSSIPRRVPAPVLPRKVTKVVFGNQELLAESLSIGSRYKLTYQVDTGKYNVPIEVYFSDGAVKYLTFTFKHLPTLAAASASPVLGSPSPFPSESPSDSANPIQQPTHSPESVSSPSPVESATPTPQRLLGRVAINNQDFYYSPSAIFRVTLPGTLNQAGEIRVPIEAYLSDGATKYLSFVFNYRPASSNPPSGGGDGSEVTTPEPVCTPSWRQLSSTKYCISCTQASITESDGCGNTRDTTIDDSDCSSDSTVCAQPTPTPNCSCEQDYEVCRDRSYYDSCGNLSCTGKWDGSWSKVRDVCVSCRRSRALETNSCSSINRLADDTVYNGSCNDIAVCNNKPGCQDPYPECQGENTYWVIPVCDEENTVVDWQKEDLGNLGQC